VLFIEYFHHNYQLAWINHAARATNTARTHCSMVEKGHAQVTLGKLVNYGFLLRFGMLYKGANNLKVALEQFNRDLLQIWVEIGV